MKVGFIGLGIMGKPMCKNIVKAGHDVCFYSRHADVVAELEALGAKGKANAAEVAAESEVVITMVPNSPQVREVALGENGIVSGGKKGLVVIDMSSIDPGETRSIGAELAKHALKTLSFNDALCGDDQQGGLELYCTDSEELFRENVEKLMSTDINAKISKCTLKL